MKKKGKLLRNSILFILLIIITFSVLLKGEDLTKILEILGNVKIEFVFIGIGCMFAYIVCEAINIGRTLKTLNEKSKFLQNIKYALIGFFFSSITPAASGGQPMQIYYMYKDKIPASSSTLALLINLTSMQIVTISLALISLCFNFKYLNGVLIVCFIIGILLNLSALILLIVSIASRRLSRGLVNFTVKIMNLFRVKNVESKKEKILSELEKYQQSAKYIKSNRKIMLKTLITTFIQFLFYYSVTYWTYRALGFNEANILEIITMQSVLFATVSGIPSPGAVGVSEGAFTEIFRNIYQESMMSTAVLLNRGINFYFFVIFSGIVTVINHLKNDDGLVSNAVEQAYTIKQESNVEKSEENNEEDNEEKQD